MLILYTQHNLEGLEFRSRTAEKWCLRNGSKTTPYRHKNITCPVCFNAKYSVQEFQIISYVVIGSKQRGKGQNISTCPIITMLRILIKNYTVMDQRGHTHPLI